MYLTLFGWLLSLKCERLALQLLCITVPDCVTAGSPLSGCLLLLPALYCLVSIAGNTKQHPKSSSLAHIIFVKPLLSRSKVYSAYCTSVAQAVSTLTTVSLTFFLQTLLRIVVLPAGQFFRCEHSILHT